VGLAFDDAVAARGANENIVEAVCIDITRTGDVSAVAVERGRRLADPGSGPRRTRRGSQVQVDRATAPDVVDVVIRADQEVIEAVAVDVPGGGDRIAVTSVGQVV